MSSVLIICGSKSDMDIAKKASAVLEELEIDHEIKVASAHRTPEKVESLVLESSADVFIAVAGLSAALPGVIASKTLKPVIGVPVSAKLGGLDALLSIAQMPSSVPVAAVGIDNSKNAAYLAAEILAVGDEGIKHKLEECRESLKNA